MHFKIFNLILICSLIVTDTYIWKQKSLAIIHLLLYNLHGSTLKETLIRFGIQYFISFISEKFTDLLTNKQNVYVSGGITKTKN